MGGGTLWHIILEPLFGRSGKREADVTLLQLNLDSTLTAAGFTGLILRLFVLIPKHQFEAPVQV